MIERRTVDELIARYKLEPTLRDCYVEGSFDKEVLTLVCQKNGIDRVIYEVDSVDIPMSTLAGFGMTEGQKQRLIALSQLLDKPELKADIIFVVDADHDRTLKKLCESKGLRYTAGATIESEFWEQHIVEDLLFVFCKCDKSLRATIFPACTSILRLVFWAEAACLDVAGKLQKVDFSKSLTMEAGGIVFDSGHFLNRLLNASKISQHAEVIKEKMDEFAKAEAGKPVKEAIGGHDLISMLSWTAKSLRATSQTHLQDVIRRILVTRVRDVPALNDLVADAS